MCTVSYLPKGINEFILTSNRDEAPSRAAKSPEAYRINNRDVFFPKDPLAGGTWFATDKKQLTCCLLNGGFEKHKHKPPYKMSRGIMVLDVFKYDRVIDFINSFEFEGIEPFTLVCIENIEEIEINEIVWDGIKLHTSTLDPNQPKIWSSSTLYPEPVRKERREWFTGWLKEHGSYRQNEIINFHISGGRGDEWNDFVMNRNHKVQTVSITSLERSDSGYELVYKDLLKEKGAKSALSSL